MSDSDSDAPSSVFRFQNRSTSVCAKGPNLNTNVSNVSFRNNMLTSTMNMPWNYERPRYAESVYEPRNMYSRRETSPPVSLHSASGMYSRNYNRSMYHTGMSSQRSMCNGRSGSPMSVRTIDSNASFSAVDIATAFKTMHFNRNDLQIIKDAYNKYLKMRLRKRVEKRRNLKMFLKGCRRRSGGDSGEQGSDSSLSSVDCKSTRSYRSFVMKGSSTRTEFLDFRRNMQDSNMYRDRTESMKQNSFRNVLSVSSHSSTQNNYLRPHSETSKVFKEPSMSQKDRFTTGYQLPSQRFNQSLQSICEKPNKSVHGSNNRTLASQKSGKSMRQDNDDDSEQDKIFSEVTVIGKDTNNANVSKHQNKRTPDDEDIISSEKKRMKMSSPKKRVGKSKFPPPILNRSLPRNDPRPNDFVFVKPQFPIKKLCAVKKQSLPKSQECNDKITNNIKTTSNTKPSNVDLGDKLPAKEADNCRQQKSSNKSQPVEKPMSMSQNTEEKLIARSKEPTEETISQLQPVEQLLAKSVQPLEIFESGHSQDKEQLEQTEVSSMSMRPSFLKRKLFSLTVPDNKNVSSDSLENSQTNVYSVIQKEKNKARKLVTSQSCFNGDALADESNLLDLIHKMVPANSLNITKVTNVSKITNNKIKPANADKKLDVSKLIASCTDTDNMSDTYTDEEIFKPEHGTKKKTNIKKTDANEKTPKKTENKEIITKTRKTNQSTGEKNLPNEMNIHENEILSMHYNTVKNIQKKSKSKQKENIPVKNNVNKVHITENDLFKSKTQPLPNKNKINSNQKITHSKTKNIETLQSDSNKKDPRENSPPRKTQPVTNKNNKNNIYTAQKNTQNNTKKIENENIPLQPDIIKNDLKGSQSGHKTQAITMCNKNKINAGQKNIQNKNKNIERNNLSIQGDINVEETVTNKNNKIINNATHADIYNCKVVVEKGKFAAPRSVQIDNVSNTLQGKSGCDRNLYQCVKSFWDTDLDSDMECQKTPLRKNYSRNITPNITDNELKKQKIVEQAVRPLTTQKSEEITVPNKKATVMEEKKETNEHVNNDKTRDESIKKSGKPSKTTKNDDALKKTNINNTINNLKITKVQKVHNNTLRIRAPRTPKIKLRCKTSEKELKAVNNTVNTVYRTLRTRNIDLSSSFKSDDTPVKKSNSDPKSKPKNKKIVALSSKNNSDSDLSFTLTTENNKQKLSVFNIRTRQMERSLNSTRSNNSDLKDLSITRAASKAVLRNR